MFKEEARIVVVLARKEWGNTLYTGVERDAIYDRPLKNEGGFNFLFMIPMVPGETPEWYPSSRIYADPKSFSAEQIARFIEFKVTDEGGIVKQLTLEDRYNNLVERMVQKKKLTLLQWDPKALNAVNSEVVNLLELFKTKGEYLNKGALGEVGSRHGHPQKPKSRFNINNHLLEIDITKPDEMQRRAISSQDFSLDVTLSTFTGYDPWGEPENKNVRVTRSVKFLYSETITGWSQMYKIEKSDFDDNELFFQCRNPTHGSLSNLYYDLKNPISTEKLIDDSFQELLKIASKHLEQLL